MENPEEIHPCLQNLFTDSILISSKKELLEHETRIKSVLDSFVRKFPESINIHVGKRSILSWLVVLFSHRIVKHWVEATEELKEPLDIDNRDFESTETPLFKAVATMRRDTVFFLLEKRADPNYGRCKHTNSTALAEAVIHGDFELTKLLIDAGADIEGHPDSKYTPLHHALGHWHVKICQLLLKHDAIYEADAIPEFYQEEAAEVMSLLELKPLIDDTIISLQQEDDVIHATSIPDDSFWDFIEDQISDDPSPKRIRNE